MARRKNMIRDVIAMSLTAIGGINWGLVGIGNLLGANWNLVNITFGAIPFVENVVYIGVGISAGYLVYKSFN